MRKLILLLVIPFAAFAGGHDLAQMIGTPMPSFPDSVPHRDRVLVCQHINGVEYAPLRIREYIYRGRVVGTDIRYMEGGRFMFYHNPSHEMFLDVDGNGKVDMAEVTERMDPFYQCLMMVGA